MHLAQFSRVKMVHSPTPLEAMGRLSAELGIDIWFKRDDCTGLAGGGNKTRKLEFLMGAAFDEDADTLITQGAVQSNHVRQTAAAAARFGLGCEVILEERTGSKATDYLTNGNVLLDRLMGARIDTVPAGTDMTAAMNAKAEMVRQRGGRPYVIPGGGSNAIGALGYADCARELMVQADEIGLRIDRIVHATGSAGTQAGLVAGLAVIGADVPVLGVGVRHPEPVQEANVRKLTKETCALLGHEERYRDDLVVCDCDYVGPGYGLLDQETIEAVKLVARLEGVLIDPVYTGKAMKGLIALARQGDFQGETVVFIHTGGAQGLHGYAGEFGPHL